MRPLTQVFLPVKCDGPAVGRALFCFLYLFYQGGVTKFPFWAGLFFGLSDSFCGGCWFFERI